MSVLQPTKTFKKPPISILGCGWFGFAFAKELIKRGYSVKGSTTSEEKLATLAAVGIAPFLIDFSGGSQHNNQRFFEADVLFICIPPKRKSLELGDYPKKIESIIQSTKEAVKIVLISSTSIYGDHNITVDEDSEPNPETESGKMVLEAENILKSLCPNKSTIIRFAGLIGPERNPGRFFAGKTDVPNGLAPVNMIHQNDAIGVACAIIEKDAFGKIYNACAPNHPTKIDFYRDAALKSGLQPPTFILEKIAFKIVESKNVPNYLNYNFTTLL
ncbi:nucleoside-diphosphate-sugar epimerase [Pedobacter sp. UYP30]|uniref:SDR family oxidoreductase n=1 Tax=Pedobacter sp. UYP30 TaxID=1756400 RepID=UPI003394B6E0